MKTDQRRSIKTIMNQLEGVQIQEKTGAKFRFRIHLTKAMSDAPLEDLNLSVRAYNCLKRANFNTIGELANAVASGVDLRSIRNCGRTSAREIMEQLFLYQYDLLSDEQKENYLGEVIRLNIA